MVLASQPAIPQRSTQCARRVAVMRRHEECGYTRECALTYSLEEDQPAEQQRGRAQMVMLAQNPIGRNPDPHVQEMVDAMTGALREQQLVTALAAGLSLRRRRH